MPQQCPPNTFLYAIKKGDTLYSLAQKYNTTIGAIISANPFIEQDNLLVGENICIPRQKQYPSCPEGNYYEIKAGDTFYSLAKFYNISLDDLKEANPGVNPESLQEGQIICIPLAVPPVTCPAGSRSYTVKKGDTFYSLSRRFNVTIDRLQQLNPGVNPDALLIGQKICVPGE